jgi:selenocysteine-specific elongation factor
MANWIIGTAGHVDHGKTALVKALTGIDTDRLQEEKERGMSIELGFASLPLSNHQSASIIDVPGHEKFIKNMLAGASGIDLALMVIAADDGVMPQTIEHLEIMQLLGLQRGVIALTKIDLVDQEWLELVTDEIREKMNGSFLAEAPILQISSVTGQGISELKQVIESELSSIQTKHEEGPFRLPIDRIFTITGIGTVVTGTLISGTIHLGDPVEVMPKKLKSRARHLQSHGHKVESIHAGMRTAVNLAGLDVEEIERGDVVTSDQALTPTSMIDARFYLLPDAPKAIENRTRIRFHLGTAEILGRIILLDKDALNLGEEAFVQIRLESPTVAVRGDRFVVRSYSPQHTIGGGTIIAPNPPKHHRFSSKTQAYLETAEKGDLAENLERIVREAEYSGISDEELEAKGTGALRLAVQEGDLKNGCFLCGQIAAMVKKEQPAAEIIHELMEETEKVLKGGCKWVK